MKILLAEDDQGHALIAARALTEASHTVAIAADGVEAFEALAREPFDALVTEWMLPRMDGIELIRRVRVTIRPVPVIIVVTTLASHEARAHALDAGADDYVARPCDPRELVRRLEICLKRRNQPRPAREAILPVPTRRAAAPFACVVIAASTGGPAALSTLLASLPVLHDAAILVVLHGPAWLLETFVTRLQKEARMKAHLAEDGIVAAPGEIFVARGDRHLIVEPGSLALRLADQELENFVRPSADPLLRSAAKAFGSRSVAVVLTGMGRDGASGCEHIVAAGGVVLAQDPSTASARSMPQTVIDLGLATAVARLEDLPALIVSHIAARASAPASRQNPKGDS